MCRHLQRVELDSDTVVFAEGDTGDAFYIIYEGRCVIERNGRTVAKIEPYNHFGEIALQSNAPRNATVKTEGPCVLVKLTAFHYELCMRHCGTQRAKVTFSASRLTLPLRSCARVHDLTTTVLCQLLSTRTFSAISARTQWTGIRCNAGTTCPFRYSNSQAYFALPWPTPVNGARTIVLLHILKSTNSLTSVAPPQPPFYPTTSLTHSRAQLDPIPLGHLGVFQARRSSVCPG